MAAKGVRLKMGGKSVDFRNARENAFEASIN